MSGSTLEQFRLGKILISGWLYFLFISFRSLIKTCKELALPYFDFFAFANSLYTGLNEKSANDSDFVAHASDLTARASDPSDSSSDPNFTLNGYNSFKTLIRNPDGL